MAQISVGAVPKAYRWFHTLAAEADGYEGTWHVGKVEAGKTWPIAGPAVCGFSVPDRHLIDSYETSVMILAKKVCPTCLVWARDWQAHPSSR